MHRASCLLLWYSEYKCLNHQQHNHVDRIVDIKEPSVQIIVTDITALPVIYSNRNQRKQSAELKRKRGEAIELPAEYKRLQRHRCQHKEYRHLLFVTLIITEKDDRPRWNQIRPVAEMRERDQASEQHDARAGSYPAVKQHHDQQTNRKGHHHIPMRQILQKILLRSAEHEQKIDWLRDTGEDHQPPEILFPAACMPVSFRQKEGHDRRGEPSE